MYYAAAAFLLIAVLFFLLLYIGYFLDEFQIVFSDILIPQFPYTHAKDNSNNLPHGLVTRL